MRKIERKVGMRFKKGKKLIRRWGEEKIGNRGGKERRNVLLKSEKGIIGEIGNKGRMIENDEIKREKGMNVRFGRKKIGKERMVVFMKVEGDIKKFGKKEIVVDMKVIEEKLKRRNEEGEKRKKEMKEDGNNIGRELIKIEIEKVENVFKIGEEMVEGIKELWSGEKNVVWVKSIGKDKVREFREF